MRFSLVLFVSALAACGSAAPPATSSAPSASQAPAAQDHANKKVREDISTEVFATQREGGITVIDVRTAEEFANGHVPGAVNVPIDQVSASHPTLAALDKDEPVYFICHSGGRSARAADMMAAEGYTAVNVLGGTATWAKEGRPVE